MADFLIPFLTGAAQKYISDEDASDQLKANIIELNSFSLTLLAMLCK